MSNATSTLTEKKVIIYKGVPLNESPRMDKGTGARITHPKYFNVPTEDEILEKGTDGKMRERKIRWYYGCTSIYFDEQLKMGVSADRPKSAMDFIDVDNGIKVVNEDEDPMLALYMKITNHNGANENRKKTKSVLFNPDDSEQKANEELKHRKKVSDVHAKIYKMDETELRSLAKRINQGKLIFSVNPDEEESMLRLSVLGHAESYPDLMNELIAKKGMELKMKVVEAEDSGVIKIEGGQVFIKGNDKAIITGVKTKDDIVAFLSSENGKKHLNTINNLMSNG